MPVWDFSDFARIIDNAKKIVPKINRDVHLSVDRNFLYVNSMALPTGCGVTGQVLWSGGTGCCWGYPDIVSGETGVQGQQGSTGIKGETGIQGPSGTQGETGTQGPSGIQGQTGIQGTSGNQGETGLSGSSGGQGETGIQGVTGTSGGSLTSSSASYTGVLYDGTTILGYDLFVKVDYGKIHQLNLHALNGTISANTTTTLQFTDDIFTNTYDGFISTCEIVSNNVRKPGSIIVNDTNTITVQQAGSANSYLAPGWGGIGDDQITWIETN